MNTLKIKLRKNAISNNIKKIKFLRIYNKVYFFWTKEPQDLYNENYKTHTQN